MRGSDGKIIALLFCLSFWLPYTLLKKLIMWLIQKSKKACKLLFVTSKQ